MGRLQAVKGGKGDDSEGMGTGHKGFGCCAHGCPLPGAISDATDGTGEYRCWAHDRAEESSQWPYLTQGIKANGWLFRMAEKILIMPLFEVEQSAEMIENYLGVKGRLDLKRMLNTGAWPEMMTHEPRPYWVQRLRGAAFKAAMGYVSEHWTPPGVMRRRALMAELAEA